MSLISLIEEHPVISTLVGTTIVGIIGFLIKRFFFKDKTSEKDLRNISTSANNSVSNSGTIGTLVQSVNEILNPSKDQLLELLESVDNWERTEDQPETWICKTMPDLKIIITESTSRFEEDWTKFISRMGTHTNEEYVNLYYNNTRLESQMIFITLDDNRYRVALPERELLREQGNIFQWRYYWDENSVKYKIMKIIGFFYHVYPSERNFINAINKNEESKFEN